tara:strand:- start:306 stop:662 length:357 start_codon:yes stop_codon:yes gene_type:complete
MFNELMKCISLSLMLVLSSKIYSEFIVLDCSKQNNWTDKKDVLYSLQIGTGSKKVLQVFKRNQLQMQLKETDSHYEIGQYIDASESNLIPLLKVNKATLIVDYSNKEKEQGIIYCRRV